MLLVILIFIVTIWGRHCFMFSLHGHVPIFFFIYNPEQVSQQVSCSHFTLADGDNNTYIRLDCHEDRNNVFNCTILEF